MVNWPSINPGSSGPTAVRKQDEAEAWTQYACRAAAALQSGTSLPEINVAGMGPVLRPRERALFQGNANYCRLYGGDGTYTTTGLLALGNPAFMIGAFAATSIINHRRKARARRDAEVRWRDHQRAGLIGTSQRLLVHTDRGWGTYAYGAITEYYPDVENGYLTIGFGDQGAPMLLAGPASRAVAVLVAAATTPDRWTQDPRLRSLVAPDHL